MENTPNPATPSQPENVPMTPQMPAMPAVQNIQPLVAQPSLTHQTAAPVQQSNGKKPPIDPVKAAEKRKKNLIGCFTAFGCSIFLFMGVIFAFLASGSDNNPLFASLGVSQGEVVNILILLVNLTFLVLTFIAFIVSVVGIFKIMSAKKGDKDAKKRGIVLTFGALSTLMILILVWVMSYVFLSSKQTFIQGPPRQGITTEPTKTVQLTAPIKINFDAQYAPINTNTYEILSYKWNFGDGDDQRFGSAQSHTYSGIGNFTATLTVALKERATGKAQEQIFTKDITIQNVKASVQITATPASGEAPLNVKLDGSKSSSANGDITAYAWDLNEDGVFDDGSEKTAELTLKKVGEYKIKLRVLDATGEPSIGEITVTVTETLRPSAIINIKDQENSNLAVGTSYIFSGEESTSPSGKIKKYSWNFSDGGNGSNRTVSHTFEKPGKYVVSLTVSDESENKGEADLTVNVSAPDASPVPVIKTTPKMLDNVVRGAAPLTVSFDASESTDPNDDIVEYNWDFDNDGTVDKAQEKAVYTFEKAGTYTVKFTAKDAAENLTSTEIIIEAEAKGVQANLKATPTSGVVPLSVKFDASGSTYADGEIVSYEWDFGEGNSPRSDTAQVRYLYTTIGTFNAKVTAIASDGKQSSIELPITVRPISVTACFETSIDSGTAPLEIEFDPTCSSGTVIKYRWRFGQKNTSVDRKPTFTFTQPGTYPVRLEIADGENVIDSITKEIIVR